MSKLSLNRETVRTLAVRSSVRTGYGLSGVGGTLPQKTRLTCVCPIDPQGGANSGNSDTVGTVPVGGVNVGVATLSGAIGGAVVNQPW
jgi:hypothetical protein